MSWVDWIPTIIGAAGSIMDRDSARSPDQPDQLSIEDMMRLLFQDSVSPWGNRTYTEGEDGRLTENYQFTPVQQAIYDRSAGAALQPYEAYPIPDKLRQLHDSLMDAALDRSGPTARPTGRTRTNQPRTGSSYTPPGVGQVDDPFTGNTGPGVTGGGGSPTERGGIPSDRPGQRTGEANAIDFNFNAPRNSSLVSTGNGQISDEALEFIEQWGGNRGVQAGAAALMPGLGSLLGALGYASGNTLDTRFGERGSDYNNQEWGGYDSTMPSDVMNNAYFMELLGYNPYAPTNPETGARLGEAGGMPGAQHNADQIAAMYGPRGVEGYGLSPRGGYIRSGTGGVRGTGGWFPSSGGGWKWARSGYPRNN